MLPCTGPFSLHVKKETAKYYLVNSGFEAYNNVFIIQDFCVNQIGDMLTLIFTSTVTTNTGYDEPVYCPGTTSL